MTPEELIFQGFCAELEKHAAFMFPKYLLPILSLPLLYGAYKISVPPKVSPLPAKNPLLANLAQEGRGFVSHPYAQKVVAPAGAHAKRGGFFGTA